MGLPSITINFVEKAKTVSTRAERGIVGIILKDANVPETNPFVVMKEKDIPSTLSAENKEQIALAMVGNVNSPSKIIAYTLEEASEDFTEALSYFSTHRVTYVCAPTAETDAQASAISDWVDEQRENRNKVKAVLPNEVADSEGVINYATEKVTAKPALSTAAELTAEYTTEKYCSRIAGLLAGTPITQSCTFSVLPDAIDSSDSDRDTISTAIDAGKLIVFNDGEKVKVARGVNSLTTTDGKSDQWKKIKVVETMDMIYDDLVKLIEDNYIGKFPNTYDNKCLVLSAIMDYFNELVLESVLSSASVSIDTEAVKEYLEEKGIDTSGMEEEDLKKADTGDKLFLKAEISILDAIEEITLNIAV